MATSSQRRATPLGATLLGAALLCSTAAAQWRQLAPPASPGMRIEMGMAAATNGSTILFGGRLLGLPSNETWRFDGAAWQQLAPASSPPARYGPSLVFDAARNVFVLFGGSLFFTAQTTNDTWEFDGVTWMQIATPVLPNATVYHGACFDSARSRVVVYGGLLGTVPATSLPNTYEYDGANWQLITTAGNPGPLYGMAMCYHAGIGKAVLFGGSDTSSTVPFDTTWLYDGATWSVAAVPAPRPAPRRFASMVYDAARGVCVLVGGETQPGSTLLGDTWEFDGTSWQQQSTNVTAAMSFGLAFDVAHQNVVRFGGGTSLPVPLSSATWLYGAGSREVGSGCAGSAGVPLLQAATPPNLGLTYHLQLSNLVPSIPIAAIALGFAELPGVPLASIGMPGCAAFVTPDVLVTVAAGGTAGWATAVPSSPALFGVSLFAQGLSIDPASNAAGLTVSNAVEGFLGH